VIGCRSNTEDIASAWLRCCLLGPLVVLAGCSVSFSNTAGETDAGMDAGTSQDAGADVGVTIPDAACVPSETPETTCSDGIDNDCDGAADCADSHCGAMECDDGDPTTSYDTCEAGVCVGTGCMPTEATEFSCDDGVDNDCSGAADCADTNCLGASCDDGDSSTSNDVCTAAGTCAGESCTQEWVCDQCGTGVCNDVLIAEDPGCGCAGSTSAPNCNVGLTYTVSCGGSSVCTYERQEVMEDCNCHWECN
jgi:hypothetical protein